ncbi:MAG: hypothetical protein ACUVS2_16720, partial [Candidatus Flexifilum sp.]
TNGGYLSGMLAGGGGNDTVSNAAFAYAGGADLGAGDDIFTNSGWLNGSIQCGIGADSLNLGGVVAGAITCDLGDDTVTISAGAVSGHGAVIGGPIDGGDGTDVLRFAFTVNVSSMAEASAISAALAGASPAGGTITIAGVVYTWLNFESLLDLLTFHMAEPVVITIAVTWRVNQADAAAPVAIYCAADAVELWTVSAAGVGSFAFSVPLADVNAGTTISAAGVRFSASGHGSFTVSATTHDGKPYVFMGSCG